MGRSVHISTEIPPPLSMVKRLRIPKARQKELSDIFKRAVERLKIEEEVNNLVRRPVADGSSRPATAEDGKKPKVATAAR
jgi:hypothetical protein